MVAHWKPLPQSVHFAFATGEALGVTPPLASGLTEPLAPGLGTVTVFGLGSAGEQADRTIPRSTTTTSQRGVGRPRAGRRGGITTRRILDGRRAAIWDVRLVRLVVRARSATSRQRG